MLLLLGVGRSGIAAELAAHLDACMIDEPPWGAAADPHRGIYPDIFGRIAAYTGLAIDYTPTPLARTLDDVASGNCSFTITSWAAGRSDRIVRGEAMAALDYGVALRKGLKLADYDQLHGLTIALPRGLLIGDPFDHDPDLRKVPVYGYEQAMTMVEGGHADGVVGSFLTLHRIMQRHASADRFDQDFVLAHVELALQLNKAFAQTDAARQLNEAVAMLRQDGSAERIIRAHFSIETD
ncbi:hypothetical protein GCM10011611_31870 [Aliidongia dinghuensis]|uniref:Transporter substrate-binding domain-containing protein n=1 Tax=Aliidongia dinghuensis TaxID=1867774 RepID=A0A8J2YW40_9PROT|nr:hypothetical protein GCM10011611_31870 [Aliidongia dinghuensis]